MLQDKILGLKNHRAFSALKYRNYRLWFWGQMVSLFGTWMQITAQGFLIYELTHSAAYLGLIGFFAGVPAWIFMLYGGVVADRMHRRNLLLMTQVSMMLLAFVLAGLTFMGIAKPWHILVLSFLLGIANAFDAPARHAFVLDMVEKEHLTNAISLNSTMFNTAMVVGPAAAGIAYALFGPAWCFMLNGLSFIAIIAALLAMRFEKRELRASTTPIIQELREGIAYAASHSVIGVLFIEMISVTLFASAYATLLPAWAVGVLHGNAETNGLLQSARGIGAMIVALWLASRVEMKSRGRLVAAASIIFPILLLCFSFAQTLWLSVALLVLIGANSLIIMNVINVLVQSHSEERFRGRIMSFYSFMFFGIMPLGALWIGAAAEHLGERRAIIIAACLSLFSSIAIWKLSKSLSTLN